MLGGRDQNSVNRAEVFNYNPSLETWTTLAQMPAVRNWAGAAEANGSIYVVDGSAGGGALNTVVQYAIATDYRTVAPNTLAATYGPAVVSPNHGL